MIYSISYITYPDNAYNYKNILVIDKLPIGPLLPYIKQINYPINRVSAFRSKSDTNCIYAILGKNNELVTLENLIDFFTFCKENNYTIDTSLTQMINSESKINNLICYINKV